MDDTVKFALTILAGIVSWFIVHQFAMTRDRVNKIRDLRTKYLIEAFQKLERNSNRSTVDKIEFESVLSDIQLFGSAQEAELARKFINEFSRSNDASLNDLLHLLRANLRKELRLSTRDSRMAYFRFISDKENEVHKPLGESKA
jgi:hypothetical protein